MTDMKTDPVAWLDKESGAIITAKLKPLLCEDGFEIPLYAEQPAPVDKYRCEQVPFSMLCYGAKFKYTPGESAVFVKIGPDLVAGWDGQKVADGWIGQPVCSFSDDGNLLAAVTLVHEQAEPVASESACTSCDGSGEYTDAIGDWRGYCTCPAGVEAEGIKGLMP